MGEPEHITDAEFTVVHPGDRQMPDERPAPYNPDPPWWRSSDGWAAGASAVFQIIFIGAFIVGMRLVINHYWPAPGSGPRPEPSLSAPYTAKNGYVVRAVLP